MPAHTPPSRLPTLARTRKARPGREWASESLYRPLAQQLIGPSVRAGLKPTWIVLTHTGLGLLAAAWLARGGRLGPALLWQVKTVLDNLDGQLARATDQTSEVGRYLDSEMDVVVNLAALGALDRRWGGPATLLLSLILSVDYLWEREYRAARGELFRDPPAQQGDNPWLLGALRGAYALYFAPQERVLGALFEARLRAVAGGAPTPDDRIHYTPRQIAQIAAQLGLSTQLLALGALTALGRPRIYLWTLPIQAAMLAGVQLWREDRVRRERNR